MRRRVAIFGFSILLLLGCADVQLIPVQIFAPEDDSGTADFSVLVALGNSLTAGVQSAGLSESHQRVGYAALVSRQLQKLVISRAEFNPRPNEFVLPGYGDPGTPGTLELNNLVPLEIETVENPGVPLNDFYPIPYNNLGLPGARVVHVVESVATDTGTGPFDLILRVPGLGTALQQASALQPTFVLLWIGANDVLGKLTSDQDVTLAADFEADYRTLVSTLIGLASSPDLVAGNIPDVTSIPFATTVPPVVVNPATQEPVLINGSPVPLIGPDGDLGPEDLVTLGAIAELLAGAGIPIALGGTGNPLSDQVVINATELAEILTGTATLNDIIASIAAEFDYPVVDVNALLRGVADGLSIGGIVYTTEFVLGGGISLDGIHPSDLGYAVVANAFISTINDFYRSSIPILDLSEYTGTVFSSPGATATPMIWGPGLGQTFAEMLRLPMFR